MANLDERVPEHLLRARRGNGVPVIPCSNPKRLLPVPLSGVNLRGTWAGCSRIGSWCKVSTGIVVANILWNLVLYRREEDILVFLVLGKMLRGGYHAAGGHVLMTMLVGPLCQSLNNFRWHIPEALGNGLAMKGVLQFVHSSVTTMTVESGAVWKIRFTGVQLSSSACFLQAKSPTIFK